MAVDRVGLARALAEIVADPPAFTDLPGRLCAACLDALPVDGVGLTLMTMQPGGRALLGATDAAGSRIEQLQFELGEGPCVSAFADRQPVLVPDLAAEEPHTRWPMFTREASTTGVAALFAFPLQVGAAGIGVLDCHRLRPGPLEETTEALLAADVVTLALLNLQARIAEGDGTLFDLSWRNHAVVHQATGALAARMAISTGEALARLRAYAFREARPLWEVAADVVAGKLEISREDE
jgi:hypothetical protein